MRRSGVPNLAPPDKPGTDEAAEALRSLAGSLDTLASVVDRNARREAQAAAKERTDSPGSGRLAGVDTTVLLETLVARVVAEVRKRDQSMVEKLLYDKRSAAFALSVSVSTIENMLARKQLSYRRCGRKVLIPAADIRRVSKLERLHDAPRLSKSQLKDQD